MTNERISRKERQERARQQEPCPMCAEQRPYYWICPCGFIICDLCMTREAWGMTCNNITWVCPDCGEVRTY